MFASSRSVVTTKRIRINRERRSTRRGLQKRDGLQVGALDGKDAIVRGGHRRSNHKWRDGKLSNRRIRKQGNDDQSALYGHRTPCMEADYRAARPDVLVD